MSDSSCSFRQGSARPARLRDNWRYQATSPTMAICHLREHRHVGAARFPVIRQLRARGRNRPSGMSPGHPLARHIDDFLTDLANANKPRNTIRAYRGDLIAFAAHHDGDIAELTAAPVRAFLGQIAGQAPATRKRKRAAVASFCKWAVRHELLDASPMDRIDTIEVPRTLPGRRPPPTSRRCSRRSAPGGRARTCRSACCGTGCCSRPPTSAAPAPRRSAGCTSRTWTCARTTSTPASTARAAPSAPCCSMTAATSRCSALPRPVRVHLGPAVPCVHQRPGRPAVLRRSAQPVEEVLRRRRRRDRHPPAPPRPCQRAHQQRRLDRGGAPAPRPCLDRDHPGLHPARRPGRRQPRSAPPAANARSDADDRGRLAR